MFNFNRKEKGQGLVEYALILVLIAIVVIVAMRALGGTVGGTFSNVNGNLAGGDSGSDAVCVDLSAKVSAAYDVYVNCGGAGQHEACSQAYQDYSVAREAYITACP